MKGSTTARCARLIGAPAVDGLSMRLGRPSTPSGTWSLATQAIMVWQATPTPAPVIERVISGVARLLPGDWGPPPIADDLLPSHG